MTKKLTKAQVRANVVAHKRELVTDMSDKFALSLRGNGVTPQPTEAENVAKVSRKILAENAKITRHEAAINASRRRVAELSRV